MSATTTVAPSRANVAAIAAPNPEPPPVTIAVLPLSRMMPTPRSTWHQDRGRRRNGSRPLSTCGHPVGRNGGGRAQRGEPGEAGAVEPVLGQQAVELLASIGPR